MEEEYIVTEWCPHCENEVEMRWSVEDFGYKAYCPICGNRLMLCDECQHSAPPMPCDYDRATDSCRFNQRGVPSGGKQKMVKELRPGETIVQDGIKFTIKEIRNGPNGKTAIILEDMPTTPEVMAAYGKLLKFSLEVNRDAEIGSQN